MKKHFLKIFFLCSLAAFGNCKVAKDENNSTQKNDACKRSDILAAEGDSAFTKEEILEDTTLFSPYHKPFYGGLTIDEIIENCMFGTSGGPGNPFTIKCKPDYKDKATGIYHFFTPTNIDDHDSFFLCDVFVSFNGEGFYADDTTQRINTIILYDEHNLFNETFPFQINQEISNDIDSLQRIADDFYLYREKDYEFYLLIKNRKINSMLINRLYCKNQSSDTSLIQKFQSLSNQNNIFFNAKPSQ